MIPDAQPESKLPFSFLWPIVVGALVGIALRLVYSGHPDERYATMAFGFVILAPIAVGAVTVFVAERTERRSFSYYLISSFTATALFVFGTLLALIEGMICAIIIIPLFAALGMAGGVLMGIVCRYTNWPKQTLSCLVLLPLLLGGVDRNIPLRDNIVTVERAIVVAAPPEAIWRELMNARDIRAAEIDDAWLFRIGVPLPLEGALLDGDTATRRVRMGKNVYFDEVITDSRPNEHVRWTYRFYPDSFPRYALDEHVVVGGRYFDVHHTSYTLMPRGDSTEVRMQIGFRVSTRFNWYARPVARFLIGNLMESNLAYYRARSEARSIPSPP